MACQNLDDMFAQIKYSWLHVEDARVNHSWDETFDSGKLILKRPLSCREINQISREKINYKLGFCPWFLNIYRSLHNDLDWRDEWYHLNLQALVLEFV